MNIEALIPSIIGNLVGGRHYWDTTPQAGPPKDANGTYLPFLVSQIVGGEDETYVDQQFGEYENVRLQVTAFAPTSLAATDLIRAVRHTMLGNYRPVDTVGGPVSVYDPGLFLRGRLQHFSIWVKP